MDRGILQQHFYKPKFPACLYNKYLARYELSTNSKLFLSHFCHPPTAEVGKNFKPPYLRSQR